MEKRVVFQGKVGVYAEIEEELIKKMKADVASTSAKVQELEDAVKRIEVHCRGAY